MSSAKIINATIFTGDAVFQKASIGIIEGKFSDDLFFNYEKLIDAVDDWIVPGFIDLQLYGGNGQLFSDLLSIESLQSTYAYSLAGGATSILPTVATNSTTVIFKAIEVVKEYQRKKLPGILGLHLEGPFINPIKKGAHLEKFICRPTLELAKQITNAADGCIKIITLAPECCSDEVIHHFIDQGIVLSAGHSNASFAEAEEGFDKGIRLATHLFNAMSPLHHRQPGLPAAIMLNSEVMCSIVADGYHVDYNMIRVAKQILKERLFLITDAVTGTGGDYPHKLKDDRYIMPDGTLSGSALTMVKAVKNVIENCAIEKEEALRMASLYAAKAIGFDDKLGKIEHGYAADFIQLGADMAIKATFKNGIAV